LGVTLTLIVSLKAVEGEALGTVRLEWIEVRVVVDVIGQDRGVPLTQNASLKAVEGKVLGAVRTEWMEVRVVVVTDRACWEEEAETEQMWSLKWAL
jgi:hypothetical protein